MEIDLALNVLFWIAATIFVVFGLLFPSLMFAAALVEKQHVSALGPASEQDQRQHRERIRQAGQPCVPFSAEAAPAELSEYDQQCIARLEERGLARYAGPSREKWVFTVRGAAKLAWQITGILQRLREENKRVEALKRELAAALPLKA